MEVVIPFIALGGMYIISNRSNESFENNSDKDEEVPISLLKSEMEDISKSSGRTVLFVSHNMDSIRRFCSKTLLLENGKVKKVGETNDVISSYLNNLSSKIIEWRKIKY